MTTTVCLETDAEITLEGVRIEAANNLNNSQIIWSSNNFSIKLFLLFLRISARSYCAAALFEEI